MSARPAAEADWERRVSAWREALQAALEREGDALMEIPEIEDPGTAEGRAAVLRGLNDVGVDDHTGSRRAAAATLFTAGLALARAFLAAGETDAGVREETLRLFSKAGVNEAERGDPAAAPLFSEGLEWARAFLAAGETDAGVREETLGLYVNAGFNEGERGDRVAATAHYSEGLEWARTFLAAGETGAGVRKSTMYLFSNAVGHEAEWGDRVAAAPLYSEGLELARAFLAAGETGARLREQTLRLFANAGLTEAKRGDPAAAAPLVSEGLEWARAFLAAGETDAGIREMTLLLFANAGVTEAKRGDPAAAEAHYSEGLEWARVFLAAGETDAGVREETLVLYVNAGFNEAERGDRGAAAALYEEGLVQARGFLTAGETDAGVRKSTLRLFSNARANEAAIGTQSPQLGMVTNLIWWWASREKCADIQPPLFSQASIDLWVDFFRSFFLDWHHAESPHGNFGGALDARGRELTPVQTALTALEGLVLWEHASRNTLIRNRFGRLARFHSDVAGVVDAWHGESRRARVRLWSQRRRLQAWHRSCRCHRLLSGFLPHVTRRLAHNRQQLQRPRAAVLWSRFEDLRTSLGQWVLEGLAETLDLSEGLAEESELLLAAVVLTAGAGRESLAALLGTWLGSEPAWREPSTRDVVVGSLAAAWPQGGEVPVDCWIARLGLPASGLSVAQELLYGPAPVLTPAFAAWADGDPEPLVRLLESAWARVCGEGERLDRVADVLAVGAGIDAMYPPLAEHGIHRDIYSRARNADLSPSAFLREELLTWQGLDKGLADEASLLLGVLFAVSLRQMEIRPAVLVGHWQEAPPWQDAAAVTPVLGELQRAWLACGDEQDRLELALFDSARRNRHEAPPIRRWLRVLDLQDKLTVEATLANGPAPALENAFAAAGRGDRGPLCVLLEDAWQRAQRNAQALARLKAALLEGWINAPLARAMETDRHLTQRNLRSALAAVLRGDARAHLLPAVVSHLAERARQPAFLEALATRLCGQARACLKTYIDAALAASVQISPQAPLHRLERAAARLFASAVHLHPGERGEAALTERLHHWARAALQEASEREDLEGLWSALESGRIALSGLAQPPPDAAWKAETADLLGNALAFSVEGDPQNPDWRRGWPPLTAWIQQCEKLRPARITVAACQGRLRPGEALVQPFFLPDAGALQALWLTDGGALQRRSFPGGCDEVHWRTRVLDPWAQWLEGIQQESRSRVWRKPAAPAPAAPTQVEAWADILAREPVRQFAATLAGWAGAAGIQRLILLLPAPLAQLPWEALPDSPLAPGALVRAVSLAHWRREPVRDTEPTPWTFYDDPQAAPQRCLPPLYGAPLEAHRVDPAPQSNRTHTSADVLAGLQDHRRAHLIVHGRYQRFAPLRSGLLVDSDQFLPLWVPAAIGVGARRVVLSACESNLTGQATTDLLGPVGVGPACVAAGAEAVLGTLWPCHDLATVVFIDRLSSLAEEEPWSAQPLAVQVAEAAQRLRRIGGAAVRALIERLAAAAGEDFGRYDTPDWQPYYAADQPFGHPKFWAPFVVVGEEDVA